MRFISIFLLGMVMFLAACASEGEETNTETEGEVTEEATEGSGEEIEITYFHPGLDQPNQMPPVEDAVKRFEEANPNINVEIQTAGWDQAYQKLITGLSGGTAPDVFYGGTRWVPAFAAMDGIQPLTEWASERIGEFHDPLEKAVTYKDDIYAMPHAFSSRALVYRTDLIEEPPATWEELVETAKRVQSENEGMYGYGISGEMHVSTTSQFFNFLFQNGGEVFDDEGNVVINSPEAVEALTFYRDLYAKHELTPNPVEYNREELPVLFKEGKIAMFVIGPWAQSMMGLEPDNEQAPYATAVAPAGKQAANTLVSDSLMMSADTEHPEAAWKLMNFLTSLEEQTKYDKNQGLVPILEAELEDPTFTEDPYFATYVEAVESGVAQPTPAVWEPFQEIVAKAVQQALNGEDPQQVLDKAAAAIKDQQLEPK